MRDGGDLRLRFGDVWLGKFHVVVYEAREGHRLFCWASEYLQFEYICAGHSSLTNAHTRTWKEGKKSVKELPVSKTAFLSVMSAAPPPFPAPICNKTVERKL